MRLGAVLPLEFDNTPPSSAVVTDGARGLADAGFDSIWTFDSIGRGSLVPDPLTLLSVAAAVTDHVELGTGVLLPPLRNTVELAHRVCTAQLICGDRLLLGVGFGSTKVDFDTLGIPFEERSERFDKEMPRLRTLLKTGRLDHIDLSPWPLDRPPPPVMLGTWGRKVESAAKDYDGWIASAFYRSDDQLESALNRYRCAGGKRAIAMNVYLSASDEIGTLGKRLERLAEAGFDDAVVVFEKTTDQLLRKVRRLVAEGQ